MKGQSQLDAAGEGLSLSDCSEASQNQTGLRRLRDGERRAASEYGVFVDLYQPITDVEEFTDITHTTIQTLMNWSSETDEPFDTSVKSFLEHFRASIHYLKSQGFPDAGTGYMTLEHYSLTKTAEVLDAEIERRKAELAAGQSPLSTVEDALGDPELKALLYLRKQAA